MAATDDSRPAGAARTTGDERGHGFEADPAPEEVEEARAGTGVRIRDAWDGLSAGRRRYVALGVVLALVGTMLIVWFALAATVTKPNWRDVAFEVPSDQLVRVRFEVTKPQEMTAVCTLLAQATDHSVVGRTAVTIPPADQRTTWHEAQIRTTSQATIGTVRTCHEQ